MSFYFNWENKVYTDINLLMLNNPLNDSDLLEKFQLLENMCASLSTFTTILANAADDK